MQSKVEKGAFLTPWSWSFPCNACCWPHLWWRHTDTRLETGAGCGALLRSVTGRRWGTLCCSTLRSGALRGIDDILRSSGCCSWWRCRNMASCRLICCCRRRGRWKWIYTVAKVFVIKLSIVAWAIGTARWQWLTSRSFVFTVFNPFFPLTPDTPKYFWHSESYVKAPRDRPRPLAKPREEASFKTNWMKGSECLENVSWNCDSTNFVLMACPLNVLSNLRLLLYEYRDPPTIICQTVLRPMYRSRRRDIVVVL